MSLTDNSLKAAIDKLTELDFSQLQKLTGTDSDLSDSMNLLYERLSAIFGQIKMDSGQLQNSSKKFNDLAHSMMNTAKLINQKSENINDASLQIKTNMYTVSAAAEELSTNMAHVSGNASDSTNRINNIASETGKVTATIIEIARNAEDTSKIVNQAAAIVDSANEKINHLSIIANDINKVTSTISGISDQTKLLALNATIEAARAGEAGIRFSVVASEVKALAGETNQATREIYDRVSTMQRATVATMNEIAGVKDIMDKVKHLVSNIVLSVDEQKDSTQEITSDIQSTAKNLFDVSASVSEAAYAVQEVTKNITQAADRINEINDSIHTVTTETSEMKDKSVKMYADAMEVSSMIDDINTLMRNVKLPSQYNNTQQNRDLFKFTSEFSVNVKDIDKQHQGIFNFINKIHKAIKENQKTTELLKILKEMARWVTDHFTHEERLMQTAGYQGLSAHKDIHKKLLSDVSDVIRKIENKEDIDLIELLAFLKRWLIDHILGTDKKYSKSLNDKGYF